MYSFGRVEVMRWFLAASFLCIFCSDLTAEECVASVYSTRDGSQSGATTASGRPLRDTAMTAAHKTLAFGSKVKVTNKRNGKTVVVTITDRGPYVKGRCIDLTRAAAATLGFSGLAPVSVSSMN
jgi:rare lipoprotein A